MEFVRLCPSEGSCTGQGVTPKVRQPSYQNSTNFLVHQSVFFRTQNHHDWNVDHGRFSFHQKPTWYQISYQHRECFQLQSFAMRFHLLSQVSKLQNQIFQKILPRSPKAEGDQVSSQFSKQQTTLQIINQAFCIVKIRPFLAIVVPHDCDSHNWTKSAGTASTSAGPTSHEPLTFPLTVKKPSQFGVP